MQRGNENVDAVILCGGRGERLGGVDKATVLYQGKSLFAHMLGFLTPKVRKIAINRPYTSLNQASINQEVAASGLDSIVDKDASRPGPIAGVEAGLQWFNQSGSQAEYLLFVPIDTPHLDDELLPSLLKAIGNSDSGIAVASAAGRLQPTIALVARTQIKGALSLCADHYNLPLRAYWQAVGCCVAEFENDAVFKNINSADDLV